MIAYQITAAHTGVLDVSVSSEDDLVLSLRDACDPEAPEQACFAGARLVEPAREGDAITIVVFGSADMGANGRFTLQATSRPIVCGDGYCDPGERCDDGNTQSGDGCSSGCTVETSESGHNGEVPHADPYVVPFVGEIHPAEDEDLVEFTVTDPATALVARVLALGEGACESGELDSVLEILDEDGTLLGIDDDGGAGTCSKVLLPALSTGRYFVRVFAALAAQRATFPYVISLDLDACGNERISEAEECDDGNTQGGDGCSALCEVEAGVSARY